MVFYNILVLVHLMCFRLEFDYWNKWSFWCHSKWLRFSNNWFEKKFKILEKGNSVSYLSLLVTKQRLVIFTLPEALTVSSVCSNKTKRISSFIPGLPKVQQGQNTLGSRINRSEYFFRLSRVSKMHLSNLTITQAEMNPNKSITNIQVLWIFKPV